LFFGGVLEYQKAGLARGEGRKENCQQLANPINATRWGDTFFRRAAGMFRLEEWWLTMQGREWGAPPSEEFQIPKNVATRPRKEGYRLGVGGGGEKGG